MTSGAASLAMIKRCGLLALRPAGRYRAGRYQAGIARQRLYTAGFRNAVYLVLMTCCTQS
jgi:hypothetical protein